jgi:tetratricopeptide (TPR) repeat protein
MMGVVGWIALCEAFLGASAPAPSFSEAWYREVMTGELSTAADLYQRIYEDGGAILAKGGPLPDVHRRAALRAGGCYEKIGRGDLAREAYAWLVRAGPSEDPSVRYARLRLAAIAAATEPALSSPEGKGAAVAPAGTPATPPAAGQARPDASTAIDRLRQQMERRETCAGQLRFEVTRLAQRVDQEARLRRRLADLGVEMKVEMPADPARGPDGAPSPIGEALRPLDPEDRGFLSLALAERYYLRGLRALRDRDPAQATEEFQKALESQPGYRDSADLLGTALGFLRPMEGVAKLAAQRLSERAYERELESARSMRAALASADQFIAQDQAQSALPELERIRSEEEWLPPRVHRAAEVGALAREADIRALLIAASPSAGTAPGAGVERYEDLRAGGRRAADELTGLAEKLTDLVWESSDRRRRAAEAPTPAGKDGQREGIDSQRRVREELERLLVRGEDRYGLNPRDPSPDGWRREFLDIKVLAQWFPEADRDLRFRKLAQEYLERR